MQKLIIVSIPCNAFFLFRPIWGRPHTNIYCMPRFKVDLALVDLWHTAHIPKKSTLISCFLMNYGSVPWSFLMVLANIRPRTLGWEGRWVLEYWVLLLAIFRWLSYIVLCNGCPFLLLIVFLYFKPYYNIMYS